MTLKETLARIKPIDKTLLEKTQRRLDSLTKPQGSLGRLEELARQIAGVCEKRTPALENKVVFTLAADHGVAAENVSAFPQAVTAQMVANFLNGGAGINVLAAHVGARVVVADVGVAQEISAHGGSLPVGQAGASGGKNQKSEVKNFKSKKIAFGTANFAKGPAMDRTSAVRSIETGIEIFEEELKNGIDIAGCGEMGIANTASSSAITAVLTKNHVKDVTGRGTGIDDKHLAHKINIIKHAIKINKPDGRDPLDVLAKIGGFEIGALCGIILAASARRIPVVIDGFISGAAALLAYEIEPKTKDYMIASHCSVEQGHKAILNHIGLKPLLDLHLRLGEGTGACLGITIAEAAVKILTQMATFESAHVSQKSR